MASTNKSVTRGPLTRKNSKEIDPWCLTCSANLRVDGVSYVSLSRHKTADLCDTFTRVLGAEFSESYASVNVCNRCERQLRRLGRYNSIILARNEGRKLRDNLEKNLAKYGQTVVVSGDDFSVSPPKPSISSVANTSVLLKRGKSADLTAGRKTFGDLSTRPSSVGSENVSSAADKNVDQNVRSIGGFRKPPGHSPSLDFKKKSLIPQYIEEEKRCESRRRNWSKSPSTSEESNLSFEKAKVDQKTLTKNSFLRQDSRPDTVRDNHKGNEQEPLSRIDSVTEEMETSDKAALVVQDSSEQFLQEETNKKKSKLGFGFKPSKNGESKTSPVQSPTSDTGEKKANKLEDGEKHRPGRVNPFTTEAERVRTADSFESALSFEDDVFVKDIIDLDESSGPLKDNLSTGHASVKTIDSEQIRADLMSDLDRHNFRDFSRASSTSIDTSEAEVDPSDYNADNRSSLSEVEERINIKSQFKGVYYNIGSTEDLLQEFESELAADRARVCKLTPVSSIDREEVQEKQQDAAKETEIKKGKMTKYESLDLDIEHNNPFYDDVYTEYNRRVNAKCSALTGSVGSNGIKGFNVHSINNLSKFKIESCRHHETIQEVDASSTSEELDHTEGDKVIHKDSTENSLFILTELETPLKFQKDITETEVKVFEVTAGKTNHENDPLIDDQEENKENEDDKPDLTDLEEPFFEKSHSVEDDLLREDIEKEKLETEELQDKKVELDQEDGSLDQVQKSEVSAILQNGVLTDPLQDEPVEDECTKSNTKAIDKEPLEDYQAVSSEGVPITKKSEKSPLISADLKVKGGRDKFKDQEPGLLCCTIL
ncbi:DNA ligase 1 [Biomphalaria glabrata]|nr:DNA ligase 1 [Biomphalaria glabrata]